MISHASNTLVSSEKKNLILNGLNKQTKELFTHTVKNTQALSLNEDQFKAQIS